MYDIFKNDFYDTKPAPKWAFTVEFFLSEDLNSSTPGKSKDFNTDDPDLDPPDILKKIVEKLRSNSKSARETWMDKLQKSVCKVPVQHPEQESPLQLFFPGYQYIVPSKYNQSGTLTMTFNDNIDRDIRCILEQLMYFDGISYRRESGDDSAIPVLPSVFRFDMLVRVYDVDRVNQYDPSEGPDEIAENGTVVSFFYESCYVSKIGNEKNSYETSDQPRTVEATIVYQRMVPLQGDKQI